jgi:hypothetical protein
MVRKKIILSLLTCVVDRHRIDAGPDPDPTFHFNTDTDSGPNPILSFTHVGKSEKNVNFIHSNASLLCFILLVSIVGVKFFYF